MSPADDFDCGRTGEDVLSVPEVCNLELVLFEKASNLVVFDAFVLDSEDNLAQLMIS